MGTALSRHQDDAAAPNVLGETAPAAFLAQPRTTLQAVATRQKIDPAASELTAAGRNALLTALGITFTLADFSPVAATDGAAMPYALGR